MLLIYLIGCFVIAKASQDNRQRPVLQEITLPRKLVESQSIRLNCDLLQGSRPIRFGWFFNDEPVAESERLQVTYRDDVSSLMIRELSVEQIGTYKCVGTNEYGSDQQTVTVQVNSECSSSSLCEQKSNVTNDANHLFTSQQSRRSPATCGTSPAF